QGDVGPVDGGGACAAVGFQDVAVDPERAFAQLFQVHHGAQAAADQPLDLDTPAVDLAAAVARLAGVGAAGQHAVLGGEPALAAAHQERRHVQIDGTGTKHRGPPHADEDAAGRLPGVAAAEAQGTQLVGTAAVGTHNFSR